MYIYLFSDTHTDGEREKNKHLKYVAMLFLISEL